MQYFIKGLDYLNFGILIVAGIVVAISVGWLMLILLEALIDRMRKKPPARLSGAGGSEETIAWMAERSASEGRIWRMFFAIALLFVGGILFLVWWILSTFAGYLQG
jgi:predicted RND superfamily exporter protein